MGALLLFLFGAMAVSFLCSVLESVLMSTPISYITMREEEGYAPAKMIINTRRGLMMALKADSLHRLTI